MSRIPNLTALLLLALTGGLGAQVIDVYGSEYDLQTAVEAAPAGATLLIHGGPYEPLVIDKPLTLIGDPAPAITPGGNNPELATAPVRLAGPGGGRVRLVNLQLGSSANGGFFFDSEPSIVGGGFERVEVFDSVVEGAPWDFPYDVAYPGADAINVDVPLLWVERCIVHGGDAANSDNAPVIVAYDAGTAIRSTGTVVVIDSQVSGGNGVDHRYDSGGAVLCPSFDPGGAGGDGVVAPHLVHANSSFSAGVGSRWFDEIGGDLCLVEPDGTALIVDSQLPLASTLSASGPVQLGQPVTLSWTAQAPVAALFLSTQFAAPVGLNKPPLLAPPLILLGVVTTPGQMTLGVPDEPTLQGVGYGVALITRFGWSNPVSGVAQP